MTGFATSNLPTNVNTVEKLAAWTGLVLARINPTLAVLESDTNGPQKVAQVAFFQASDGSMRLTIRLSVPIDPAYASFTKKFWENATDLSNTAIPAGYTTN